MAEQSGMTINASAFLKRMGLLNRMTPPMARRALGRAGLQLMDDCINKFPSVPLDVGSLERSGSVIVDGVQKATSQHRNSGMGRGGQELEPTPAAVAPTPQAPSRHVAVVGFNKSYAVKMHVGWPGIHYQQQKGTEGANYIGAHLFGESAEYMRIMADSVREDLRKGKK